MLWSDPAFIDFAKVEAEALGSGSAPRIQFSRPDSYPPAILEQLNHCCERFGARVVVRFYGHYKSEFEVEVLRRLPAVRSLWLHLHQDVKNLEFVGTLEHLEELILGVFEGDYPNILREPGVQRVRRLVLIDNRRNNVDLAPLVSFPNLADLTLCAHARHIEVLGGIGSIQKLALNKVKKPVRLPWIKSMAGLRDLQIMLGGRTDIDEVAHDKLERLRVDRIRGIEHVNLAAFPSLARFHMEDQLQVPGVDLTPVHQTLQWMTVWNCKNFAVLPGLEAMEKLEFLWLGKTKLDPEEIVPLLPKCLREAKLTGYGQKRDAGIKALIEARGIAPAGYVG